MMLIVIIVEPP